MSESQVGFSRFIGRFPGEGCFVRPTLGLGSWSEEECGVVRDILPDLAPRAPGKWNMDRLRALSADVRAKLRLNKRWAGHGRPAWSTSCTPQNLPTLSGGPFSGLGPPRAGTTSSSRRQGTRSDARCRRAPRGLAPPRRAWCVSSRADPCCWSWVLSHVRSCPPDARRLQVRALAVSRWPPWSYDGGVLGEAEAHSARTA